MATTTAGPTVDDLIKYARSIAHKIGMANDPQVDNKDRNDARYALHGDWLKVGLPMFDAARRSCPAAVRQVVKARIAIANAIIQGGRTNTEAFGAAVYDLECAPLSAVTSDVDTTDYIGPLSPAEWRKRFGGMSETKWRRVIKTLRTDIINSKSIRIHPDDVARYENKAATTRH